MSQVGSQRKKPSPIQVVAIGALLTGIVTFSANLFITANTFRHTLEQEQRLRIRRTLNLLTVIRDELTRVRDQITAGQLDVRLVGPTVVPPRAEWPAQMWSAARWGTDVLNVDTTLLKLLASLYEQIYHAHSLLEAAQRASDNAATISPFLGALIAGGASSGGPVPECLPRGFAEPTEWLRANLEAYKQVKSEISKRLPDVLATIDFAILKLQEESRR